MNLTDLIRMYDKVLPHGLCSDLIDKFERSRTQYTRDTSKTAQFTKVDLAQDPVFHEDLGGLQRIFEHYRTRYFQDTMPSGLSIPYTWERFRIKRYLPNDHEEFPTHVDAADLDSAKRFLVMFFYLNDVDVGGETTFPELNIKVTPRAGRLIMFPPHWMYPHAGEKPVSGPKYLLSTYLHHTGK